MLVVFSYQVDNCRIVSESKKGIIREEISDFFVDEVYSLFHHGRRLPSKEPHYNVARSAGMDPFRPSHELPTDVLVTEATRLENKRYQLEASSRERATPLDYAIGAYALGIEWFKSKIDFG